MTSIVDVRTGTGGLLAVLIRCLLVAVDETSELAGTLDVEDTSELWEELGGEDVWELGSALEVDDTVEIGVVLETEEVLELGVTEKVEPTELEAEEVWMLDDTVDFVLESALEVDDRAEVGVELETEEVLELGVTEEEEEVWKLDDAVDFVLETDVIVVECELED